MSARPIQAGLASAASIAVGAALPLVVAATVPAAQAETTIAASSLVLLFGLGALAMGPDRPGRLGVRTGGLTRLLRP